MSRRSFSAQCLYLLHAGTTHAAGADSVVLVSTGEYQPWTSASSLHQGFVNRVVKEAFARRQVLATFAFYPWARAGKELLAGRVHASSFWFRSDAAYADYWVSDPVSEHQLQLFGLKSKPVPTWQDLTDLKGSVFGLTAGYTYNTQQLWKLVKSGQLQASVVTSDEQNLQKLLLGRIDIFPAETEVVRAMLNTPSRFVAGSWERIVGNDKPLSVTTGHVRFLRDSSGGERFLHLFNAGLAEMKHDGTYKRYWDDLQHGLY